VIGIYRGEMSQPLGLEALQLKIAAQNGKITGDFELLSKIYRYCQSAFDRTNQAVEQ